MPFRLTRWSVWSRGFRADGQLGTGSSSRRYKEDIEPMGDASERLFKLRPVKFHYKKPDANGQKPVQFGLTAEEVAEVFPELVLYDKGGQPETAAYHLLAGLKTQNNNKMHLASRPFAPEGPASFLRHRNRACGNLVKG